MGEPLEHFRKRREASWQGLFKNKKLPAPKNREEMVTNWQDMERAAADIAYIRSRYLFHTELQYVYRGYRRLLPSFLKTGYSEESAGLFEDSRGSLSLWKQNALKRFVRMRCYSHFQTVKMMKLWFFLSLVIFILSCVAGFTVVNVYSGSGEVFLPPQIKESLERGELWTNILTDTPVQGGMAIIINNILVALRSFGYGLFLGIPSLIILIINGWHLGSVFAGTHSYGMAADLAQFVMPHGIMELTIIIFSCSLGMHLGLSTLTMPRGSRLNYFTSVFWRSINSVIIVSLWLIVCGIIESQVSPHLANMRPHIIMLPVSLCTGLFLMFIYYKIHHGVFRHGK